MKRRDFLGYSALFLSGCTVAKTVPSTTKKPSQLRFAVTDLSGIDELEAAFGPFRIALEEIFDLPVTFYPVANYSAAAPALLANDLDIAFAGPSEYLLLKARAQAEPLVEVTRQNYYSVIMVRSNSGIETLADLKGKTIAMRTEGSTAGHIFPMKVLIDAGLDPDTDFSVKMLNREAFAALMDGEVDAWSDSRDRYVEYVEEPGLADSEITALYKGDSLPGDIFVANPSLGDDFIATMRSKMLENQDRLLQALSSSEANQKYRESTIAAANDSGYNDLRDVYHAIGQASAIQ